MTLIKERATLTERLREEHSTRGADVIAFATTQSDLQRSREDWQNVIDKQLIEWGQDPDQLQDDGLTAPSRDIIGLACQLAVMYRDSGMPSPLRAVPNGSGGIVFERKDGATFETLEIRADGSVEVAAFKNSRLRYRRRLR
jgi:hypothetical protein